MARENMKQPINNKLIIISLESNQSSAVLYLALIEVTIPIQSDSSRSSQVLTSQFCFYHL